MSGSYDIFLSYSGAQKGYAEHLNKKLAQVCGHYSVFFDKDSMKHDERICTTILENAQTCKLAVVLVSEEYFARSRWPMLELAAITGSGIPSLLPVFLELDPNEAMKESRQSGWWKKWQEWDDNDKRSKKNGPSRAQPRVWKEAVDRLLDTSGPIFSEEENDYAYDRKSSFLKKVAKEIAVLLDVRNRGIGPSKAPNHQIRPRKETNGGSGSVNVQILGSQRYGEDITCILDGVNGGNGPVNVQILGSHGYEEDITRMLEQTNKGSGPINVQILGSKGYGEGITRMLEWTNKGSRSVNVQTRGSGGFGEEIDPSEDLHVEEVGNGSDNDNDNDNDSSSDSDYLL